MKYLDADAVAAAEGVVLPLYTFCGVNGPAAAADCVWCCGDVAILMRGPTSRT